jgi:hypothetical protein
VGVEFFNGGIVTINGLVSPQLTFVTGTTGTDFGITAANATVTFNIPTADATHTGKLAAADWTTFNSKQPALPWTTAGDMVYYSNSAAGTRLPIGAAYQVVGANSGATAPTYLTLAGTTNRVSVATAGTTVTFSGPQDLAAASSPTFAGLTLSGLSGAVSAAAGVLSAGTLSVPNGGTGVTAVTVAPAANAFAGWDANENLTADNFLAGYTTTATAAGTTTLVVGSDEQQFFTGTTTQTVLLPVTSTLVLGQSYMIVNNSTQAVTVQSSGGNTLQAMAANTQLVATCISLSGTGTASWSWQSSYLAGGSVTSVGLTVPAIFSVSGSPVTSSGTLAVTYSGTALPIANGGTGQTTATAAFDALSPLTTQGDVLYYNGTHNVRLGPGTNGQFLTSGGAAANPSWTTASSGVSGANPTTVNAISVWGNTVGTSLLNSDLIYASDVLKVPLVTDNAANGTNLTVKAGDLNSTAGGNHPGDLLLQGGASTGSNSVRGGQVQIAGGSSYATGNAVGVSLNGGTNLFAQQGHQVVIYGGPGQAAGTTADGGVVIQGGNQTNSARINVGYGAVATVGNNIEFKTQNTLVARVRYANVAFWEWDANVVENNGNTYWYGQDQTNGISPLKGMISGSGGIVSGVTSGAFFTPNNLLETRGGANASYFQATNTATGTAAANGILFGLDSSGNGVIKQQSNFPLNISVNGAQRLQISTAGKANLQQGQSTSTGGVGCTVNVNTTSAGNGADTTEDNLMTYSVPASTLGTNNDVLEFHAFGTTANNADTKTIRAYFGATKLIDSGSLVLTNGSWEIRGKVIRTGATAQIAVAAIDTNSAAVLGAFNTYTTPAETLANAITLKFTGQAGTANANDIVQTGLVVEWKSSN